ncbi:MAG: S8 family serine peptidase [Promethearchaeota archaeon]
MTKKSFTNAVIILAFLFTFTIEARELILEKTPESKNQNEKNSLIDQSDISRVTLKFIDEAMVRSRSEGFISLTGFDLTEVKKVFEDFGHPPIERLFTRDEETINQDLRKAEKLTNRNLPDLNGYYELTLDSSKNVEQFIKTIKNINIVQMAYRSPPPVPPPEDISPPTPDFEPLQGYLDPAPDGIDAKDAWTRSEGHGEAIFVVDIEYDWLDTHEDLGAAYGGKLCYEPREEEADHGEAVLGILVGGENGYGVTGIANQARIGMVTHYPKYQSYSVARAIDCAASHMEAGDVLLIEAQTGGAHDKDGDGTGDYVPVEWRQAEFDAIAVVTAQGIVVVEAAGNGNENLDKPVYGGKFDRSERDSWAIIVGAGAPPNYYQPVRSRLDFSTYGSRVDVQGWGRLVTTAGYGDLFDGEDDPNQYYTDSFGGTSSASAMVAGAAAILQGVQMSCSGKPMHPIKVRQILTETGTPQEEGPYPGHIGPLPNLKEALAKVDIDNDSDGFAECENDCDDNDPSFNPGVQEYCDGLDNDCNDSIDDVCKHFDINNDGFIDGIELAWLSRAFGSSSNIPEQEWWYFVDYNHDGQIDGDDLAILASDGVWGESVEICEYVCP